MTSRRGARAADQEGRDGGIVPVELHEVDLPVGYRRRRRAVLAVASATDSACRGGVCGVDHLHGTFAEHAGQVNLRLGRAVCRVPEAASDVLHSDRRGQVTSQVEKIIGIGCENTGGAPCGAEHDMGVDDIGSARLGQQRSDLV